MVGSAVLKIIWSREASSMATISPAKTGRMLPLVSDAATGGFFVEMVSEGVIGFLLGWKLGRCGPGGNRSACRWRGIRSGLLGDNQARHCLAGAALDRCRPWAWAARGDVRALALSVKREPGHVASW